MKTLFVILLLVLFAVPAYCGEADWVGEIIDPMNSELESELKTETIIMHTPIMQTTLAEQAKQAIEKEERELPLRRMVELLKKQKQLSEELRSVEKEIATLEFMSH